MSKFDKKTIATMLAFAALLGNKTSATTINPQTVGAVGGAASSNSEKLKKTQGMGIGAKVAIGAAALVGAYATANEVLGDTGLVNHPAMGRFTAKKTIEYWMRDVKKEEELIDQIIQFIDDSDASDIYNSIEAKKKALGISLLLQPTKTQIAKLEESINEILMEKKDLISNIKIDNCSISLGNEEEKNNIMFGQLLSLVALNENFIKVLKDNLSKIGLSRYSIGGVKFNLSKNSIFFGIPDTSSSNMTMLGNTVLTLNNDGSLTVHSHFKKFNDLISGKVLDNFSLQFTIPAPKK